MKKVSILLSCFRGSDLIETYIDFLLTPEIVKSCTLVAVNFPFSHQDPDSVEAQLKRYPDLVLVNSSEDASVYDAWNVAIRNSTTEFVCNLNLDDRVASDYFTYGVENLVKYHADVFSSFSVMTSEIGKISPDARKQQHIDPSRFADSEIIEYGIEDMVTMSNGRILKRCIPHCAPIWRRSLHDQFGFFDSKTFDFSADFEFWLRVAAGGKKLILSKLEMTLFFSGSGTASDRLMHAGSVKIIERWKDTFPPPGYKPTHLGKLHDQLHHCMNMNVILSSKKYYAHLMGHSDLVTLMQPVVDTKSIGDTVRVKLATNPDSDNSMGEEILKPYSRLSEFKDRHKGERCILLCNGPSLNQVDFSKIDKSRFVFFGLNKIYMGFERLGIQVKYLAAVNKKVVEQAANQYNKLPIVKFIGTRVDESLVPEGPYSFRINTNLPKPHRRFSEDICEYVHEGWTVTHAALQIIHYMGFSEVYIVGMDHRFTQHIAGQENKESIIHGADVDHFDPAYFGNGQSWDLPDLANSEISYKAALAVFRANNRHIFDCTIDGACTIFPRLDIESLYTSKPTAHLSVSNAVKSPIEVQPQVSVIMPVFNCVPFLREAIDSVLSQDLAELELIIVDDGSSDGSLEVAAQLANADRRIRVLTSRKGKGVSGARNTGLEVARGRYIAFLDADDAYDPGALSERLRALEASGDTCLVHSCVRFVNEKGQDLGVSLATRKTISYVDMNGNAAHLNSIMGRSDLIKKFSFNENLGNGEDWLFLASLLRSGARSEYVEDGGAIYRIHPSSTVLKDYAKHESGLVNVIDWLYSSVDDNAIASEFRNGLVTPPKTELLTKRRLNLFIWALLAGDEVALNELRTESEFMRFLRDMPHHQCAGPLKVGLVRQFLQRVEELQNGNLVLRAKIKDVAAGINLIKESPGLYRALDDVLKLSELGSESVNPIFNRTPIFGPYTREDRAHWDETEGIAKIFSGAMSGTLMVDVGAHYGTALLPFLDKNWKIFAFEPDKKNRAELLERLSKHKNKHLLSLDIRCVSKEVKQGVSFFTSEQSTGISGLSAFHETHQESQKVDITTLTEYFRDKPMPMVDFLKIDTEGHDLFVLQGFPWERGKPAVIECEFEDAKTVPLGYSFHDLARFLVDKGYTVYVSEWHPIIRYGIRHDWRQLMRYPCELADPTGWGNLLAFRDPIDEQALISAVKKVLKVGAGDTGQRPAAQPKPAASAQPAVALPVSSVNLGFRIDWGAHFTSIALNQWRFTDAEAKQKLWVAAMDSPGPTAGRTFVGSLRLMADRAMTVNVSLGRHGKSEYEGASKRIALVPGVPQTVKLDRQFKLPHKALKLQIEVLDLPGGGSVELTIDGLGISESLTSVRERVGVDNFDFPTANRLFREGDYPSALGIYLWLSKQRPLSMYGDNAVKAARKVGMPWVNTPDELAWITSTDQ